MQDKELHVWYMCGEVFKSHYHPHHRPRGSHIHNLMRFAVLLQYSIGISEGCIMDLMPGRPVIVRVQSHSIKAIPSSSFIQIFNVSASACMHALYQSGSNLFTVHFEQEPKVVCTVAVEARAYV